MDTSYKKQVNATEKTRKITKIGNSLGLSLPPEMLKKINLNKGDQVIIDVEDDKLIIKKQPSLQIPEGISPDFFDILSETMEEYDKTIKGLRDK